VQPLDHQQRYKGCPNLDAKGVLALSYEGFDLQVLLQRLEEELDLPPGPVDLSYGARREPKVIGEKNDILSCFGVLDSDPAERPRISLLHPRSGKTDDLVGKDMPVSGRSTDFLHGIDAVVLHPGDEEDAQARNWPKFTYPLSVCCKIEREKEYLKGRSGGNLIFSNSYFGQERANIIKSR